MSKEVLSTKNGVAPLSWNDIVDDRLQATLKRLSLLNLFARQNNIDPKQIAVPISDFRTWGHSETELRLLTIEGVLLHVKEIASSKADQRKFQDVGRFVFFPTSCFLLAQNYQLEDHQEITAMETRPKTSRPSALPFWDLKLRRLSFGSVLVKHFRVPAQNQETILSAFQEEGWPERISDPIPPNKNVDSKQRLHDAIRSLNRNQASNLIKFRGDGTGEGIIWSLQNTPPVLPTKRH